MGAAPFNAVWQTINEPKKAKGKMISGKDNQDLLRQLLVAHLAPSSKAQITRTLGNYKALRGTKYSVPAADLEANLPASLCRPWRAARSGLKMGFRSPVDVVAPWSL